MIKAIILFRLLNQGGKQKAGHVLLFLFVTFTQWFGVQNKGFNLFYYQNHNRAENDYANCMKIVFFFPFQTTYIVLFF